MIRTSIILSILLISFYQCKQNNSVKLTDKIDPEIVLINIEEGDRAFIGNLLLKIDSCRPILIAIAAWFINEKDPIQDSVLINAFKTVHNDILAYTLDSIGKPLKSHQKFKTFVSDQGFSSSFHPLNELESHISPIITIDNTIHEQFPLKIIKHWKPDFESNIKPDEPIPIEFTRTLEQFINFNGSELNLNHCKDLNNKIVLLGYLGPSNEDKHFTPIRLVKEYPGNEPDTYGLVMIANEIRTILKYGK